MATGTLAQKIIAEHVVEGEPIQGVEVGIKIDQTLSQDATGTMAFLQFEAMGLLRVRTELSVIYVDHNTLQTGYESGDDHKFLRTAAARWGILYSRAGNGICHQVHLERFAKPGATLLGSDSHTTTGGGVGSLAIGAGGLDVAVAMGGGPFFFQMPRIMGIKLTGTLSPWVSAKDVILEVLRRLGVKGGVGYILEYVGEGVERLSVPERATIANMGMETGALTSIFPSDQATRDFLTAQRRERDWRPLASDEGCTYDDIMEIDLSSLEPMAAMPHMPDNVAPARGLEDVKVDQVIIGSCTNSSFADLMTVAAVLRGRKVHPDVSVALAPGSRQVLRMLSKNGALTDLIDAGVRILECACGPCIGMGQAPPSGGVSVRTFNRNFKGRSGTADAQVYLVSPETAAATALNGRITDPRTLGEAPKKTLPCVFDVDDGMIIPPDEQPIREIVRGPNIKPLPTRGPLQETLEVRVLIKVEDNITTDHIMPAGAKILPLRSNIPAMAKYVFSPIDEQFADRAQTWGGGVIVAGSNYGQGSSREHAAIAPMYLGVQAVIAKSFARIHRSNLINFGIVPLAFSNPGDYEHLEVGSKLEFPALRDEVASGRTVKAVVNGRTLEFNLDLTERERNILLAGGLLNYTRSGRPGQR